MTEKLTTERIEEIRLHFRARPRIVETDAFCAEVEAALTELLAIRRAPTGLDPEVRARVTRAVDDADAKKAAYDILGARCRLNVDVVDVRTLLSVVKSLAAKLAEAEREAAALRQRLDEVERERDLPRMDPFADKLVAAERERDHAHHEARRWSTIAATQHAEAAALRQRLDEVTAALRGILATWGTQDEDAVIASRDAAVAALAGKDGGR